MERRAPEWPTPDAGFGMATRELTPAEARSPRMASPFWGIRTTRDPGPDPVLRARALAPRLPTRAFFFGTTAAAIHGLPLPFRFADQPRVHVGVTAGARRVQASGIQAHHVVLHDADLTTRHLLRVTTVARTWCDLATTRLTLAELVAAGDRAVWHRSPLTTLAELRDCVERYEGRRGSRVMRQALALLNGRADSPPESELRVAIHLAGLPSPTVNGEIRLSREIVIHPDLSWGAQRIAVEYEGDHHRTGRSQWHDDIRRAAALQEDGWQIYRATSSDYANAERLIAWLSRRLHLDPP